MARTSPRLAGPAPFLVAGCLLLLLSAVPAAAQNPADRARLDAFRDTLRNTAAIETVRLLDRNGPGGAVGRIRAGLTDARRGELGTDRDPFDEALRTLEQAISGQSDWPYPWYALGLVRQSMWDRRVVPKETPYMAQGLSYRRAAMDAYAHALKNDSTFIPAADALATLITAMGHRLLPPEFLPPLQTAALMPAVSPEVQLAISRLQYDAGRYPETLVALGAYLRQGGDSGMGRLEQARTLFALGRADEAIQAYFEGIRHLTDIGRAAYRTDLAWVAADWELGHYDSLTTPQVGEWIGRFWRERDALSLRSPNERIREHLRRWVYVHQAYLIHRPDDAPIHAEGLTSTDFKNPGEYDPALNPEVADAQAEILVEAGLGVPRLKVYTRTQWEVDDRGVIYMRHGEPARRVSSVSGPPNESWAYDLPEGRKVFHFLGSRALGTTAATTLVAALPLDADMLDARAGLETRYADLASRIQGYLAQAGTLALRNKVINDVNASQADGSQNVGSPRRAGPGAMAMDATGGGRFSANVLQREIIKNQKAIAVGVTTDGFPQHFKNSLDAIVQVYGVGFGEGEPHRVLMVFAVPGRSLVPHPRPDGGPGLLYPISFRMIAMDREHGIVRQLDTTRVFLAKDTLRGDQHLSGLLEMPVPPGTYQIRTLVTAPGLDAATGTGRDSVEIPRSPADLVLSDLILGQAAAGMAWPYAGTRVPLNPLNAYPRGADADLFYEMGGLQPGKSYTVAIALRRAEAKPDDKPAFQVGFEVKASAPYERVTRNLGLGNVKPGGYILQVRVREDGTEREVERRRALNILEK
jgi:tetratricopeptide (TPR) repeat protein